MNDVKQYTLKELLDKLPSSWDELTLSQYRKMGGILISDEVGEDEIFNGVENSIAMVSVLLDISIPALHSLPFYITAQLCEKLSFTVTPPVPKEKSVYNWKNINEISTSDLIIMIKMGNDFFANSNDLIKSFCKDNISDDEIDNMPMSDVVTGFFLLVMNVKKSMDSIRTYLIKKIVKQVIKEKLKRLLPYKQIKHV